jgi:peptidyl-dipeptidase A
MKTTILSLIALSAAMLAGCQGPAADRQAQAFVDRHIAQIEPVSTQINRAYWDATTTGKPEDFKKFEQLQVQLRQVYQSPKDFNRVKAFRTAGLKDPILARQIDKLYLAYLSNQIPADLMRQIVELDTRVQENYNNYRGTIDGRKVTMSEIYDLMTLEKNTPKRQQAWLASKQVGNAILDDFLKLIRLRNQAAKHLGFANFHEMTIVTGEQDVAELDRIFKEIDDLTREPYRKMKDELDTALAAWYGIGDGELMPWHYHDPFFQRTPLVYEIDLDTLYKDRDVKKLAIDYYAGVGLPVDDILARSDLYDRQGKYPHAYSTDLDRNGDVRILCNLQSTERWMETILHELGHAIYSKYHDRRESWLLREPGHSFMTEATAMFFGRLSRNPAWMQAMLKLSDQQLKQIEPVTRKYLQFQEILFARWALVMWNFEKALYADPEQDLNTLWWDLVERYQFMRRPPGKPDAGWASKLHFTTAPCYYHNYMLGELLASQFDHALVQSVLKLPAGSEPGYVGDPRIGKFFREKVFGPGAKYTWNETIRRATGEPLTAKYFVEQFLK